MIHCSTALRCACSFVFLPALVCMLSTSLPPILIYLNCFPNRLPISIRLWLRHFVNIPTAITLIIAFNIVSQSVRQSSWSCGYGWCGRQTEREQAREDDHQVGSAHVLCQWMHFSPFIQESASAIAPTRLGGYSICTSLKCIDDKIFRVIKQADGRFIRKKNVLALGRLKARGRQRTGTSAAGDESRPPIGVLSTEQMTGWNKWIGDWWNPVSLSNGFFEFFDVLNVKVLFQANVFLKFLVWQLSKHNARFDSCQRTTFKDDFTLIKPWFWLGSGKYRAIKSKNC